MADTETQNTPTEGKAKRQAVATKTFLDKDGNESRHATKDSRKVKFAFTDGSELIVAPEDIDKSLTRACALYGIAQKIGDSYSGAARANPENPVKEATERAAATLDNLQNGVWVNIREGGGGPRFSMLVEAIVAAAAAAGKEADPAIVKAKLQDDTVRAGAMQNPTVAAEYERIKAERAMARSKEKAAEAAQAGTTIDDLV